MGKHVVNCKESSDNEFAFIVSKMKEQLIFDKLNDISDISIKNTIRVLD